ncbi:unnamed protein product [Phyllotreta striolata]|uniref:Myotubularin phosphatase domain-containing protein n=1 Tax=Phyllotreta striolata TaxID=444603 RepID=A0A9N9TMY5_PHYSR|nr:unnamed protein product [Phyllotreta striolata]
MNDSKENSGFKSYIAGESELESINLEDAQKTKFLEGETLVDEEPNVLLYFPLTDRNKYLTGTLTVTTFKLSFVTFKESSTSSSYLENLLLGPNEVCLSCIDRIYQLGDRTKKKLMPGQSLPAGKIKDILIVCKNMRSFEFGFRNCGKNGGRKILNALLHHVYPKRHSLLFCYDYRQPYVNESIHKEAKLFRKSSDWEKELKRTKCQNWRLSMANCNFQISPLLIETMVIPQSVSDTIIKEAVEKFRNRFCPIWVWGTQNGAALIRMADLLPTISDRTEENKFLEHIRKSHPDKKQPRIIDLSWPTPKDIRISYQKLRDLCIPETTRSFKQQDFKFYGLLDGTKWLNYVSACLSKAVEAAEYLNVHNSTVVLQEGTGQDLNCVVSSLTQLILDPYSRTKFGFQSLIQKEWLALGHPFANRLGHVLSKEIEQSPIFLLFLDCVWQIIQQFPQAFQINETYLTTLWDSAHLTVFETFLFNCERDRFLVESHSPNFRSLWDWKEQFAEKDIVLFCNPLYNDGYLDVLPVQSGLSCLDIWTQCYFRWLPDLEIPKGGKPQIDLFSRYLVSEILQIREDSQTRENSIQRVNGQSKNNKENYVELMRKVNGFFPFGGNLGVITIEGVESVLLTGDNLDSQSILNFND